MNLALRFLTTYGLRVERSLRVNMQEWGKAIEEMLTSCSHAREVFSEFAFNIDNFRAFLFECPCSDVRLLFERIAQDAFLTTVTHDGSLPAVVEARQYRLAVCIIQCLRNVKGGEEREGEKGEREREGGSGYVCS